MAHDATTVDRVEPPTLSTWGRWCVLVASFLSLMFDGVQIGLFPLVVRPALKDLLQVNTESAIASWNSVLVACFLLGAAFGGFLFGWLGDKVGRVRALVLSVLAYSLFTGACYFATSPWQLGLYRFLGSLGVGGAWSLGVALVVECWPDRLRPVLAGVLGASTNVGFLLIAVMALCRPVTQGDWRWTMLAAASPALLALVMALMVPESERWRASKKQKRRSPVLEIFGPQLRGKTFLAMVLSAVPLIGTWAAVSGWTPLWADQMAQHEHGAMVLSDAARTQFHDAKTPAERHAVLERSLTKEQWATIRGDTANVKAYVQVMLAIGSIVGCCVAPVVGGRYGRRPVYIGLCLLSLASCAWLYLLCDGNGLQFMVASLTAGTVTAAFYGWLPLYLPELFPTHVRATGQGISFNAGRIVAAVGSIFMGQFVAMFGSHYGHASAAICLVYVLGLIAIWFAPETRGVALSD